ncbi:MAG: HEAT repeat domain-containing protein [Cytophagales bacterium]|nr:HEAT repeat domain-containing protein [Cytophagales bacterium]
MKTDKIRALLEKYYAGETGLEEEEQLRSALKSMEGLPQEMRADAELLSLMHALTSESFEKEFDVLKEEPKQILDRSLKTGIDHSWTMRIAAGFSLLVVGVFAGWIIGKHNAENRNVAALRQDIDEMKRMVVLSQLKQESASERILATYKFKELDSANDEVLDALIYTFNNDVNTNVKNAAAEALYKFGNHDKVRKTFINGLSNQSDPVLQIKLIDMLVSLDEKRALPKLQEMMQTETQLKVVKQKAAQGIGKLL